MPAWYRNTRNGFLSDSSEAVRARLHSAASRDGWNVEPDQDVEWERSIAELQVALRDDELRFITGVLAEYDFRRRGLRIDFVLIANGTLFVLEFKRNRPSSADRDQVMNYCVNLVEFHESTQSQKLRLFPVLVSEGLKTSALANDVKWSKDWPTISADVTKTHPRHLGSVLALLYEHVDVPRIPIDVEAWDSAPFSPSSTIIDAAVSLFGQHDVSAIRTHTAPKEAIDRCVSAVLTEIATATELSRHELILVSGSPGAGKTLVGLAITFARQLAGDAVFVTGNAPLVEVINGSLRRSYLGLNNRQRGRDLGGYTRKGFDLMARNADFKVVKAHRFLDHARSPDSARASKSADGRIVIFDEAQRTYSEGKIVNRRKLESDEASLIVSEMARRPSSIIVLLLGHNQNINLAETGPGAWLKAARAHNWHYAVSDETLALEEFSRDPSWRNDPLRLSIGGTHLAQSMRDQRTRNGDIERWAHYVMTGGPREAEKIARLLPDNSTIKITRSLYDARAWVRSQCVGEDRCGIIASGQGRRLRAEGIFVDEKPDIVPWMLEPGDDVRSSNMLEQTQNQYQIQGLEVDYAVVAWDADLRRHEGGWKCFNVSGRGWQRSLKEDDARCNSYRVLLTRSRKGMIIYVPLGDREGRDPTREPAYYQGIVDFLMDCGAQLLNQTQRGWQAVAER